MDDKPVILITGAAGAIGLALAQHYVERPFEVIGCSRRPAAFEAANYTHHRLDITDEDAVKQMFARINTSQGRLDVLINNAAVHSTNYALLTDAATVRKSFEVNTFAPFVLCREAARLMKRRRFGRIVNISTVAVPLAPPGSSVYTASKAALEQMSYVLAAELAADNITVNILALSVVRDCGMANRLSEQAVAETISRTRLNRPLATDDITNAVDFLIAPATSAVTGQRLCLGGL